MYTNSPMKILQAHPWLTESQNERLPLRVTVQVLFFEQLRLRTSIAGWFFVSENQDQMSTKNESEVGRGQGRTGVHDTRERVQDLERECEYEV
ncbi:BTB/POZ domain-containing protein-like protein [Tanacetum coccineum]